MSSFGKVAPLFAGSIDPIAEEKTVIFRPDSSSDTIRVGDLVCYNWDLETDHEERGTNPSDRGATYAEGSQNYTGRLYVVEKPTEENIQFFAGAVASLGPKAGKDGDTIKVYVPNGAVVPVMVDQDTVNGRTIVAVQDGKYEGSFACNDARPVGVALETVSGATSDRLCWTKLDPSMFLWQYSNADSLLIDDDVDAWTIVNRVDVEFAGSQWIEALTSRFELLGAATGKGTAINAECEVGKVTSGDYSHALRATTTFGAGFGGTAQASGGGNAAELKVEATAGANLTSQVISVLKLNHMLPASGITGPSVSSMIQLNCTDGANVPDYFIYAQNPGSIAYSTSGGVAGSKIGAIKLQISGQPTQTCYLRVYDSAV